MVAASIIIATYNGEKYIRQQMDSILDSAYGDFEVIISDDGSTDGTINIVESYKKNYNNIIVTAGPKRGVIKNFEHAIARARGDIIFLSDQDDIWLEDKFKTIMEIFEHNANITCVLHDVMVVDADLHILNNSFFSLRGSKTGFFNNLVKNSYMGSAMAFRSSLRSRLIPIPEDVPMHDQWIGMLSDWYGKTYLCRRQLGLYRRHDSNVSSLSHGSVGSMIRKRFCLIIRLAQRILRKELL